MNMHVTLIRFVLPVMLVVMLGAHRSLAASNQDPMSYIENDHLRLGADLDIGGSITFLSVKGGPNMINSHDWGRQIQMSFYSGPQPFEPNGKKPNKSWAGLGWNPIQSGDCYGHRSQVLAHRNDGETIYIKCRPMHWPLNNQPGQCIFECWYTLDENRVQVVSRLTNARDDKTQYAARTQELPAIYTNGPWYKLVAYKGDQPFTGAAPTVIVDKNDGKGWPWRNFYTAEKWVALLDDNDQGLGIYEPGVFGFTGGFAGRPKGTGGTKSAQTGYMAPTIPEILDHNITYTFNYTLIAGSLKQIREYVYQQERNHAPPRWTFREDRQHWTCRNITDGGWPIKDALRFELGPQHAMLIGPHTFWKAEDVPVLKLRAGFKTQAAAAQIHIQPYDALAAGDWAQWGHERDQRPKPAQPIVIDFPITGDGQVCDITIPLSKNPRYKGAMTQLTLVLPSGSGEASIESIQLLAGERQ